MSTISHSSGHSVFVVPRGRVRSEIQRLESDAGMSKAKLRRKAREYRLDARRRKILERIDGLEWLARQGE